MYKALILPIMVSVMMHSIILAVLLIDWNESPLIIKKPPPSYIKATLVTLDKPKAKPVSKPKKTVKPKKIEQEKTARNEQLKKERAQQAAEKKRLEQRKKAQQQAEQARREQQRQERLQRQAEQELADALAAEDRQQQAETDAELANSYIGLITEVIQNNWSRPPSARNNMEAELIIQLVPAGDVVSVSVVKSSGNAAFDRSAENAVLKAERFPELQSVPIRVFEKYFRRLRIKFRPEDLRL